MRKKLAVDVAAAAERDLLAIFEYIAQDDSRAAHRWWQRLEQQVRRLSTMAARGPIIPEAALLGVPYRHVIQGSYRVIYRIDEGRILVVRIVHGAQVLRL